MGRGEVLRPAIGGVGGGITIAHFDTFPDTAHVGTRLIEVGGFVWGAVSGDNKWHLMTFEFTDIEGEIGETP